MKSRPTASPRRLARLGALMATAALGMVLVAACGGSSSSGSDGAGAAASAASAISAAIGGGSAPPSPTSSTKAGTSESIAACSLLSAADLSQAVGVIYTKIDTINGSQCNVTGASEVDSFSYSVTKEDGALTTWDSEVATIKADDSSAISVSGIGDRAEQGAVKEFAAETKGYIVFVMGADFNNPATAKDFTHTKAIENALISKI